MNYKTPHSSMQSASNFIMGIFLVIIVVLAFSRCTTSKTGCRQHERYVGY